MIFDKLENAEKYFDLHPNFRSIFAILQALNLSSLEEGCIELDGNYVFININNISGINTTAAKLETHIKYIDIHIALSNNETIGYQDIKTCFQPIGEYDSDKDIMFYNDKPKKFITLEAKQDFAIFFPNDAHAPGICDEKNHQKLIVKVSCEPNNEKPTL